MATYKFRYSAIATTSLANVDSLGGYAGSGSNSYTNSTWTELGTDISDELVNLMTLCNNIYSEIITVYDSVTYKHVKVPH